MSSNVAPSVPDSERPASPDVPQSVGGLTKQSLLVLQELRVSGRIRELLVEPELRHVFDEWEASTDY